MIHDTTAVYQVDLPSGGFTRVTSPAARFTDALRARSMERGRTLESSPSTWQAGTRVAAGDIAFVEERMLITITDEASSETAHNQLAEFDLDDGTECPLSG